MNRSVNDSDDREATVRRPEAIAPKLTPNNSEATRLDPANRERHILGVELLPSAREVMSCVRTAKAVPRMTIPINIKDRGICKLVAITANAAGKAVKRMVTATISQT